MIKGTLVGHLLKVIHARKPASMYRRVKGPAHTQDLLVVFLTTEFCSITSATERLLTGQFDVILHLSVDNAVQVSILPEAGRVIANANNQKVLVHKDTLCVYISSSRTQRNKQANGAGADRVSQGMLCFRKDRWYRSKVEEKPDNSSIQTTLNFT